MKQEDPGRLETARALLAVIPDMVFRVSRDVTEHKRREVKQRELERRVQHAQKLESLGVERGAG